MTIDLGMFHNIKPNTKITFMGGGSTFSLKGITDFINNGGTFQYVDDALFIHDFVDGKWVNTKEKHVWWYDRVG